MEFTQVIDLLLKGGAGLLPLFLTYCVYTLWNKLQLEQQYSRDRDAQVLTVLQKISDSLGTVDTNCKDLNEVLVKEIKELRELIVRHLLEWKDNE